MPNPDFLLCDADALIQLFLIKQIRVLREFREAYGVQPLIVPEVEMELRWHAKFQDQFVPDIDKALSSHLVHELGPGVLRGLSGGSATAVIASIDQQGRHFRGMVDRGEAFTFAAANVLGCPALSHDRSALSVLQGAECPVPATVLRVFDLIVLLYRIGVLSERDGKDIRQALLRANEYLPRPFRNASFLDAMPHFNARAYDAAGEAPSYAPASPHDQPLVLVKLPDRSSLLVATGGTDPTEQPTS